MKTIAHFLSYDPISGYFTWINATSRNKMFLVGKRAGAITTNGYIAIKFRGKLYYAHRIAWFFMTGCWPTEHMDHKNGKRHDNRWSNLRIAGFVKNSHNRKPKTNTKCGLKGVFVVNDKFRRKPYAAKIGINGKTIYLGYFTSPGEAHAAYCKAAATHHGVFARTK